MIGDDGAITTQLGLAKNERENRDVQVMPSNAQQSPGIVVNVGLHGGKDFGGVKLLPLGVQREGGIERGAEDFRGHTELLEQRLPQPIEQGGINFSHRQ